MTGQTTAAGLLDQVQFLRGAIKVEMSKVQMQLVQLMNTAMAKMQAEADRRLEATLQTIMKMLQKESRQDNVGAVPLSRTDVPSGCVTRGLVGKHDNGQQKMHAILGQCRIQGSKQHDGLDYSCKR